MAEANAVLSGNTVIKGKVKPRKRVGYIPYRPGPPSPEPSNYAEGCSELTNLKVANRSQIFQAANNIFRDGHKGSRALENL